MASASITVNEEKVARLAALTLANLAQAPKNRQLIEPFEHELALIASADEKTSKIIVEILADLDQF